VSSATERVGRYQLLEPIGVGPCGSVSRAKVFGVAGFERQFAIKRFHPELTANPTTAQALSAAARGYGSLEHPRIARMSEFGVAQGTTFTAVEYVAGLDALRLIAEAKLGGTTLAAGGALALVSQAARAVGYAHGRGLSHLGLSPTNVIVTSEGDIKITDFGILAATLPPKPTESSRLAHRVQYLAPEQLANEATSAATDVFALGVLAYELVTGQRTFRGETPQQIAQAVMAGPPAEPPLPRPIARVLQRCLARSPFERFPDARALADALDAALRVAPVPGTRKDIGAQVTATLDRIAALNEGELSGMLAVDVAHGPMPFQPSAPPIALGAREPDGELSTLEFVRPDVPVPGPTPLVGPRASAPAIPPPPTQAASTVRDLPKAFMTVPGLAPPPIPVPPGVVPPSAPPPLPTPATNTTLVGIQSAKPPPVPLGRVGLVKVPVRPPTEEKTREVAPQVEQTDTVSEPYEPSGLIDLDDDEGSAPSGRPRSHSEYPATMKTNEMPPLVVEQLKTRASKETGEVAAQPVRLRAELRPSEADVPDEGSDDTVLGAATILGVSPSRPAPAAPASASAHGVAPPSTSAPIPAPSAPSMLAPSASSMLAPSAPSMPLVPARSRLPWILGGVVGLALLGVGGWFAYDQLLAKDQPSRGGVATVPADAQVAVATRPDAGAATTHAADASVVAIAVDAAPADARAAVPADAQAVAATPPDAQPATAVEPTTDPGARTDSLTITSTPAGARVFLDGADAGVTPLTLPGNPDRHTVALLMPGHELYVAQVDGHGKFAIPLKEVTPTGGPAGIKVIKCKDKDRYYVYVDGKPTGMTCPTERIEAELGPHVVEVYDVVSDARRKFEIEIKDTRLSHRVRVE